MSERRDEGIDQPIEATEAAPDERAATQQNSDVSQVGEETKTPFSSSDVVDSASNPFASDDADASQRSSAADSSARVARCAVHADRNSTFTCDRCGTFACADCRFGGALTSPTARFICLACAAEGLPQPIAFERVAELGWVRAFFRTTADACLSPRLFFRTPSVEQSLRGPVTFSVVATLAGIVAALLFVVPLVALAFAASVASDFGRAGLGAALGVSGLFLLIYVPIALLLSTANALLRHITFAMIAHGSLALLGANKRSFEETVRATGYTFAPDIIQVVPILGQIAAIFWCWILDFYSIRETHRCSTDRALLAAFGVRFLILGLVTAAYVLIFAAALIPAFRQAVDP